jgi:hypothetical protein
MSDSVNLREALKKMQEHLLLQHNYMASDLTAVYEFEEFLDRNKDAVAFLATIGVSWPNEPANRAFAISLPVPAEIGGPAESMLADGREFDALLHKSKDKDFDEAFEFTLDESPAAAEMQSLAIPFELTPLEDESIEQEQEFNLDSVPAGSLATGFEVEDDGDTDAMEYPVGADLQGYVSAVKDRVKSWFGGDTTPAEKTDAYNDGINVGDDTEGDEMIGAVKGKYEKKENPKNYFYGGGNSYKPVAKDYGDGPYVPKAKSAYAQNFDAIFGGHSGESHDTFQLEESRPVSEPSGNSSGSSDASSTVSNIICSSDTVIGCGETVTVGDWITVKKMYPEVKTDIQTLDALEVEDFLGEPVKVISINNFAITLQTEQCVTVRYPLISEYYRYQFTVVPAPADEVLAATTRAEEKITASSDFDIRN